MEAGREIPLSGELVTGPRSTVVLYPNGPRNRVTEVGDAALMDLSGRFQGYWFDCTNTHIIAGRPTSEEKRYAKASQDACEAAMAALKPGREERAMPPMPPKPLSPNTGCRWRTTRDTRSGFRSMSCPGWFLTIIQ